MAWRCVYRKIDGAAISFGTDIEAPVPEGHEAVLVEGPPTRERMWDRDSRSFKDRPPRIIPDRLRDLNADLDQDPILKDLPTQQRNRLDALVMRYFGGWRQRNG